MKSYNQSKESSFKYLSHDRFNAIYQLSKLDKPSWELIGEVIFDKPISAEEYYYVISKTRRKFS